MQPQTNAYKPKKWWNISGILYWKPFFLKIIDNMHEIIWKLWLDSLVMLLFKIKLAKISVCHQFKIDCTGEELECTKSIEAWSCLWSRVCSHCWVLYTCYTKLLYTDSISDVFLSQAWGMGRVISVQLC